MHNDGRFSAEPKIKISKEENGGTSGSLREGAGTATKSRREYVISFAVTEGERGRLSFGILKPGVRM